VSEPGQLSGIHMHGQVAELGRALQAVGDQQRHILHVRHPVRVAAGFGKFNGSSSLYVGDASCGGLMVGVDSVPVLMNVYECVRVYYYVDFIG